MLYVFDDYTLDTDRYILLRDHTTLPVEPKVFDLLAYFLEHRGDVVTKEMLLEQLWPDQFVSESALTYCIMAARKSIGDSGRAQRRIRTVHGRGYRFIGAVEARPGSLVDAALEPEPIPTAAVASHTLEETDFIYWQRAARRAIERVAHMEAIEALSQGVEALKSDPDVPQQVLQDLTLQVTLNVALSANNTMSRQAKERAYLQMREHCSPPVTDCPPLFQIKQGLWAYNILQADFRTARLLGNACLEAAQRTRHVSLCAWSHYALGMTLFESGELPQALEHFEQCLHHNQTLPVSPETSALGANALAYAARTLWCQGQPNAADERMETALLLAQQQDQPMSRVSALISTAYFDQLRRETDAAHHRASEAVALATQHDLPHWAAQGEVILGWALSAERQVEAGMTRIRHGVAAYQESGAVLALPTLLAIWADAARQAGQMQKTLSVIDDGLKLIEQMGSHYITPELYRLKGVCLFPQNPDAAEDELHRAMRIAARQHAKLLELRAAVSLGELWHQRGDTAQLRNLLLPRYNAVSSAEGTIDAYEAQCLLA